MGDDATLVHFGVKGMRWGQRRREEKARKLEAKVKRHNEVLDRINKQGPKAKQDFLIMYAREGPKAADRILDIMSKHPEKSFDRAYNQQIGEAYTKKVLVSVGAVAVGTILANL